MLNLRMIEVEEGFYSVVIGDRIANQLGFDEALGVVASAILRPNRVPYLKAYDPEKDLPGVDLSERTPSPQMMARLILRQYDSDDIATIMRTLRSTPN